MMEYRIVEQPNVKSLEEAVKNRIDNGWEVIGGVTVTYSKPNGYYYHQALIKGANK